MPAIVDVPTGQVVTNDFPRITLDFSSEWREHHRDGAPDLYPEAHREEIDAVMEVVYRDVNNGVYRAGFAKSQESYERAYTKLFRRLDWLTDRLATQRYLVGDTITEADVRLFTTLARFDAVYHGHFKCNRQSSARCPSSGPTRAISSRRPGSATRSTSSRSSATTTGCTRASTRRRSCHSGPTRADGWIRTAGRRSVAHRSVRGPHPGRRRERTRAPAEQRVNSCAGRR